MSDQDVYKFFDNAVLMFAVQICPGWGDEYGDKAYMTVVKEAFRLATALCTKLGRPYRLWE